MKDKESDTKNKTMDYEVEGCKNLDKKKQNWTTAVAETNKRCAYVLRDPSHLLCPRPQDRGH